MTTIAVIKDAIKGHLNHALFSLEKPRPQLRGKVRDIFILGDSLLMINTDRVSAFDQVLGTIPLKGALLCEQAEFWFKSSTHICKNHLLDRPDAQILVCKKAEPFKVEVIVRGFLAGSLLRENKQTRGSHYGLRLDPMLKDYERLITPILTPTTKADSGNHDEPISAKDVVAHHLVSKKNWQEIEAYAHALFQCGSQKAEENGLLLVDTKYEFGLIDDQIHLIDEIHTSDSSRFFIKEDYLIKFNDNKIPIMLDKEFLRQHLLTIGVNPKGPSPIPALSEEIRLEVAKRYFMLTEKIIGTDFLVPKEGAISRVHKKVEELIC